VNGLAGAPGLAWLQVVGGAFLISFSAPFVRVAEVAPSTAGFYRMVFGAAALALVVLIRDGGWSGLRRGWAWAWLIGFFFALDLWFWHRSIHWIGPGLATLLANFQVFGMTLAGMLWLRERPEPVFGVGLLLAAVGLWFLFGQDWVALDATQRMGVVFGLLTALAYTGYILTLRQSQSIATPLSPQARLFQVCVCTGVLMAASNAIESASFAIPDAQSAAALIGYGVFCQVVGWLLITTGLPRITAAVAGLLLLLQPVLSVTWDLLFFGLRLAPVQIGGIGLALLGIYVGSLNKKA